MLNIVGFAGVHPLIQPLRVTKASLFNVVPMV
eukprot:SAG31_NODE_7283_length_1733_cov_1.399633_3_plen_31_part_01